jgi:UDP:flavonoid glycosyltransferase YjiC (YdhE family)
MKLFRVNHGVSNDRQSRPIQSTWELTMATILMATWDGAGNFPPQRSLVRLLVGRGHKVSVLCHDHQRAAVEADGADFVPYAGVSQVDAAEPGIDAKLFDLVVFAEGIGLSLAATIQRTRPDVLLIDPFLAKALEVAHGSGLPVVALGSTLHSFMESTPLKALIEASNLVLTFSDRAFELGAELPVNVVHVGPLRPRGADMVPWPRRLPGRPLVVASLSTSHQEQETLLQKLCDALGGIDVEAVVTTGRGIDPASLTAGDNTTLVRLLPHEAVLPETDLLITHAGHGTVMAGATFGVPMLCLPMGRDQPMVAGRVAALGLGTVLETGASVAEIQGAVGELLSDQAIRRRSRAYAEQVAVERRDEAAAELVEGLMRAR